MLTLITLIAVATASAVGSPLSSVYYQKGIVHRQHAEETYHKNECASGPTPQGRKEKKDFRQLDVGLRELWHSQPTKTD